MVGSTRCIDMHRQPRDTLATCKSLRSLYSHCKSLIASRAIARYTGDEDVKATSARELRIWRRHSSFDPAFRPTNRKATMVLARPFRASSPTSLRPTDLVQSGKRFAARQRQFSPMPLLLWVIVIIGLMVVFLLPKLAPAYDHAMVRSARTVVTNLYNTTRTAARASNQVAVLRLSQNVLWI